MEQTRCDVILVGKFTNKASLAPLMAAARALEYTVNVYTMVAPISTMVNRGTHGVDEDAIREALQSMEPIEGEMFVETK
jgi:hypothetical protein